MIVIACSALYRQNHKNRVSSFERGENLLQNSIYTFFVFRLNFSERGLALNSFKRPI